MANFEKLLTDLYETLFQLRYPGIAQITAQDIEQTILGQENRLFLLSWLISQNPIAKNEEFSTNTDECKIVKWYSNMGICNNPEVLMGKVPMQNQVFALKNLLLYMINILTADQTTSVTCDQSTITDILKKDLSKPISIIPSTCSLTSKLNYNDAVRYLKSENKNLKTNLSAGPTLTVEDQSLKKVLGSKGNHNSECGHEIDRKGTVEKFVEVFESVDTWPDSKVANSTIPTKSMDDSIGNVYANLVTLKETLCSKDDVSKFVMTEGLKKCEMPLDAVIEEVVIRIEQLGRLQKNESYMNNTCIEIQYNNL